MSKVQVTFSRRRNVLTLGGRERVKTLNGFILDYIIKSDAIASAVIRDQGFKDFSAIPLCSERGKVFKRIRLNENAYYPVLSVKLGHFPPSHNLSSSLFPEQLFNFSAFYTESQGSRFRG